MWLSFSFLFSCAIVLLRKRDLVALLHCVLADVWLLILGAMGWYVASNCGIFWSNSLFLL